VTRTRQSSVQVDSCGCDCACHSAAAEHCGFCFLIHTGYDELGHWSLAEVPLRNIRYAISWATKESALWD
jgi:hypothetical protein